MESYYLFYFEVKDVIEFAETQINVYASTYREALQKIYKLKLPQLERYADIEEHLKLTSVEEKIIGLDEEPAEEPTEQ